MLPHVDVLAAFGNQPANSAEEFKHTTPGATKCLFFCSWQSQKRAQLNHSALEGWQSFQKGKTTVWQQD
jgi:hypothetical protein